MPVQLQEVNERAARSDENPVENLRAEEEYLQPLTASQGFNSYSQRTSSSVDAAFGLRLIFLPM